MYESNVQVLVDLQPQLTEEGRTKVENETILFLFWEKFIDPTPKNYPHLNLKQTIKLF